MLWRPPLTHTGSLPSALIFYHFERKKIMFAWNTESISSLYPVPRAQMELNLKVDPGSPTQFYCQVRFYHFEDDDMLKEMPCDCLITSWQFAQNFFEDIHIWNDLHGNKKEKRVVNNFGFCKISSCPLSPLKLVQKVSTNRRQKFVDTHFSHKLGFGAKIWRPWDKIPFATGPDTFGWDPTTRMCDSSVLCTLCHKKYWSLLLLLHFSNMVNWISPKLLTPLDEIYHICPRCG